MFLHISTSIERKLRKELERREIDFIFQYRLTRGVIVDFAFPKSKLVVECDGDYWHANPEKYTEDKLNNFQKRNVKNDHERMEKIRGLGWNILRFWEDDIEKSMGDVMNQIEDNLVEIVRNKRI